jgi:hypothetical protein
MKKLSLGAITFADIIEKDLTYADKTAYLYKLVQEPMPYFLSRPPRFGKSVLVSTLKEIFLGRRDLFKGLWIDRETDYDWTPYPVVHIDMFSEVRTESLEALNSSLLKKVEDIANKEKIFDITDKNPVCFFATLIDKLVENYKNKLVVLIDNYDYPFLVNISDIKLTNALKKSLNEFYSVIKSSNYIFRFVFITGVTIFHKESIFFRSKSFN